MVKIYQFPQGAQRQQVKQTINGVKRKRWFGKIGHNLLMILDWCFFTIRLAVATVLHFSVALFFSLLYTFKGVIFFLGGGICIFMYYHLNHHFISPDNYTIPFLAGVFFCACIGEQVVELMNNKLPFHQLLRVAASNNERIVDHSANDEY